MVYTKHFNIHTVNNLRIANRYISNAEKTVVHSREEHLENLFPYITNDDKTISKQLVSGYHIISVENAMEEFYTTKEMALMRKGTAMVFNPKTGRMELDRSAIEKDRGRGQAVLGHHIIQSFSPEDNLTPEQIHEIGRQTMLEFTGGEYEFVIATHVDKNHIHNHIVMNSTNFMTGKEFPWKVIQLENGNHKNVTKEIFEKVSDKIASKAGAKIIDKQPKLTRTKYVKWSFNKIYKDKIRSRLDFLLEHAIDLDDFMEKAKALQLKVDFSNRHARFKLLDEPQEKFTRGRSLEKGKEKKYTLEAIEERLQQNDLEFSIQSIQDLYQEQEEKVDISYDYQIKIEEWQLSHTTDKGYYFHLDFGVNNRGEVYVPAFKVEPIYSESEETPTAYYMYLKKNDFFHYTSHDKYEYTKYIPVDVLTKQLTYNNGSKPLYREPVIERLNDIVSAINFLAKNGITDGTQLENLEVRLQKTSEETYETLKTLDKKIGELINVSKELLIAENNSMEKEKIEGLLVENGLGKNTTYEILKDKIESYQETRDLLSAEFEQTLKDIAEYKKIKYVADKEEEQTKENRLK